jgi:hypothetical protein
MAHATLTAAPPEVEAGPDPVGAFFADLDRRPHEPLLDHITAIVRFDVTTGDRIDHWLVLINHGLLRTVHSDGAADCVVRGDVDLMTACITGRANAMAAYLRGQLILRGNAELLVNFQRLFPSPPRMENRS